MRIIKLITIIIITTMFFGCAPQSDNSGSLSSENSQNKLIGAWKSYNEIDQIFIFDEHNNWLSMGSYTDSVIDPTYEYAGSYELTDTMLTLKRDYEEDICYEISYINSDTIRLLRDNVTFSLIRCVSANTPNSLVGSWRPVFSKNIKINVGTTSYWIEKISFYNDGTYRSVTENNTRAGRYEMIFDGDAIRMTESTCSGEIDIELLGNGLMLFETKDYDNRQYYYILEACE